MEPHYLTYAQSKAFQEKGCSIQTKRRFFFNSEETTEEPSTSKHPVVYALEQWQVVEWLWSTHKIWIEVRLSYNKGFVALVKPPRMELRKTETPKEAYSEAFDFILKNLI